MASRIFRDDTTHVRGLKKPVVATVVIAICSFVLGAAFHFMIREEHPRNIAEEQKKDKPRPEEIADVVNTDPADVMKRQAADAAKAQIQQQPASNISMEALKGYAPPPKGVTNAATPSKNPLEDEAAKARQAALKSPLRAKLSSSGTLQAPHAKGGSSAADTALSSQQQMTAMRESTNKAMAGLQNQLVAMNADPSEKQNGQDEKINFMKSTTDDAITVNKFTTQNSRAGLLTGALIPAVLLTAINSDLPGQIVAMVREDVYDTKTGKNLLIPKGSRLVGLYDSKVSFGQGRILLAWTRLILPDARSIVLERFAGVDMAGQSGLEDEVNTHLLKIVGASLISSFLSVGSNVVVGNVTTPASQKTIQQDLASQLGAGFNSSGQSYLARNINVQPTLSVRQGFPFNVFVNKDLELEPYRE